MAKLFLLVVLNVALVFGGPTNMETVQAAAAVPDAEVVGALGDTGAVEGSDVQADMFGMGKGGFSPMMSMASKGYGFGSKGGMSSMEAKMRIEQMICPMSTYALGNAQKAAAEMKMMVDAAMGANMAMGEEKAAKEAELELCDGALNATTEELESTTANLEVCSASLEAERAENVRLSEELALTQSELAAEQEVNARLSEELAAEKAEGERLRAELAATQNELAAEQAARMQLMAAMAMIEEKAEEVQADVSEQLGL